MSRFASALVLCGWLVAGSVHAETTNGLAVVAFSGSDVRAAAALAERLAEVSAVRVVPPSGAGVVPTASPDASEVRDWAQRLAVDSIVLTRIETSRDERVVSIDLRSGHSGGPIAEHRRTTSEGDLGRVLSDLADSLLDDLHIARAVPLPPVGAPALDSVDALQTEGSRDDSRGVFRVGSADEPLSIDSDELELTEQGDNRHLVFRRNVRVTQGDIQLLTENLEAFYESGSSQPEKLIATGDVKVVQGERRARCDRAVYRRAEQTVECSGHAELVQRCDRVRGPTIQFDLDRDRVRVLGGASVVIRPDSSSGSGCSEGDS